MQKKLVFKNPAKLAVVGKIVDGFQIPEIVAAIIAQRGYENSTDIQNFLVPQYNGLHDPFLMKGMQEAVDRIEKAILSNENILIYGDYDVDGTSAVALMESFLSRTYTNVAHYIPDRYREGYGISDAGVDFAIDNNFTLVIALDCGIKSVKKISRAKEGGVDFVICDHHLPEVVLPEAIILNPKQPACQYPYKELSGCGIGFKLVQALNNYRCGSPDDIADLLDLVVISIAADIVPMNGENRILSVCGLYRLNHFPLRPGIEKMLESAAKKLPVTIEDIVFGIAPRINAAGRIESGNKAVDLLLADDERQVGSIAWQIEEFNKTRKQLDRQITAEALELMNADSWYSSAKSTVIFNPEWHKGVVGIVASRLIESHYKPTIVLTESHGKAVGSARSVYGFNVCEAIGKCSHLLEQYGGHFYAAGLTLPVENIGAFRDKFNDVVEETIREVSAAPQVEIDAEIKFEDIFIHGESGLPEFFVALKKLAPFGPDNMNPVFISRNVRDTGFATVLKGEHLKMSLTQDDSGKIVIPAIAFGMADKINEINSEPFNVVYTLAENMWNGRSTLQIVVKEIVTG